MSRVVNGKEVACALWVSSQLREAGWLVEPVQTYKTHEMSWPRQPMAKSATGCEAWRLLALRCYTL